MSVGGMIRSMRPQSIAGALGDIRDVIVEHVTGTTAQSHPANLAVTLKQAKLDCAGVGGEDGDIDPIAARVHAESLRFAVRQPL
jgi:hypothetical protein